MKITKTIKTSIGGLEIRISLYESEEQKVGVSLVTESKEKRKIKCFESELKGREAVVEIEQFLKKNGVEVAI